MQYKICIIPILFILIGFFLNKYPPKHSDRALGYKSPIFMKNEKAWDEGNKFFGKITMYIGFMLTILSIGLIYLYKDSYFSISSNLITVYIVGVLISIICTEFHLFIMFGNKKIRK